MKLASVLILKDEAACIRRCIESLRGVDEIVCAVDDRTKDGTMDILKELSGEFPILAEYRTWRDNFARARNEALNMTDADWRLNIDADETLGIGGVAAARRAMNTKLNAVSVRIQWPNHSHRFPRLIRKGVRYQGIAHEFPVCGPKAGSNVVLHCTRSPAHELDPDRAMRLMIRAHTQDPRNPRTLYYLAREHWYRKEFTQALPIFGECIKLSRFPAERADAHLYMARMLWQMRQGDTAREHCLLALATNANFKEALRLMAEMSFPKNAEAWNRYAGLATNEEVLFVRNE